MHNAEVLHDDRCRDRIGEVMAEDNGQGQVELPRPEAGEEMDVGESMVDLPQPSSLTSSHSSSGWIIELRNQAGLG